jgi:predicted anti-sigma-YlaC factor YlaD
MRCRQVRDLLPGLADRDPKPGETAAVEAHLEACPSCSREAREFLVLGDVLRQQRPPEVPLPSGEAAAARILERERAARRSAGLALPRWQTGLALAAIACAAVFAFRPAVRQHAPPAGAGDVSHAPVMAAEEPLPALLVVDDEWTGRQVLLGPSAASADRRKGARTP